MLSASVLHIKTTKMHVFRQMQPLVAQKNVLCEHKLVDYFVAPVYNLVTFKEVFMKFANNLHYLRKRDKVTQEALADELGVSRQSVSKWETGEAYPETDKLIMLCDIFGVSLDDMLRSDLAGATQNENETATENLQTDSLQMSAATQEEYIAHMDKFSKFIALGVFLVLLGVGVCMVLCGVGEMLWPQQQELFDVLAAVAVILFVAIAVFLFVFAGIGHDNYCKEHPKVAAPYSDEQFRSFQKRFAVSIASLIAGILLDVVFLVVFASLIDAGILASNFVEAAECFVVAAFLIVLAFLVGGIVFVGIQHSKYDIEEYNKQAQSIAHPSKKDKFKDAICGVVMLTATAVYLIFGFVCNIWHPTWVVFPIGGIFCAIFSTIYDAKK